MVKRLALLLTLLGGSHYLTGAEWFAIQSSTPAPWEIVLVGSGPDHADLRLDVPGLFLDRVEIDGIEHVVLSHPDAPSFLLKGLPGLPRINASVALPPDGAPEAVVLQADWEEFRLGRVAPSKGNLLRSQDPSHVPYEFSEFYRQAGVFPEEAVHLSDPFIFRDVRGVTAQFQPVRFNPSTNMVEVAATLTVRVSWGRSGGANPKLRAASPAQPQFRKLYRDLFLNHDETTAAMYNAIEEPGHLVILAHDNFLSAVQPLAEWKRQKGIPTTLVPKSQVGSTTTAIKNYLQTLYNQDALTYVILVGDDGQIPVLYGSTGAGSDPTYVMLEGTDYYPDAFISRLSGTTVAEVENQVNKMLDYEKTPPSGDWMRKGSGVASAEGASVPPDYLADFERADILRDLLLDYNYSAVDQIYDPGATSSQLISALNAGRSIYNYIGHGSGTSWGTTGFNNANASALTNGDKLPYIVDVSCLNGQWHGMTCLAEAFLRNGNGGAVGMFSSSVSCSWVPPCVMQKHIVELLVGDQRQTMGGLSMHGSIHTVEAYNGSAEGVAIVEEYNLFGDCTLPIRTDVPVTLAVSHAGVLPVGSSMMTLSAGVAGAMVGVVMNGELIGSAIADAAGNAVVTFSEPLLTPGEASLTVTAYNALPYIATLEVIEPEGAYVMAEVATLTDPAGNGDGNADLGETVYLYLEASNVGSAAVYGVVASVTSSDPFIAVTDPTAVIGDLAAGNSTNATDPISFQISSSVPSGQVSVFEVALAGVGGSGSPEMWTSTLSLTIGAPVVTALSTNISETGTNGVFDPGETVELTVAIMNSGTESALGLTGSLASGTPYLSVQDGVATFGTLAVGATAVNSSNPFTITASSSAPPGTAAAINLTVTALSGYSATLTLEVIIGQNQFFSVDVPQDFGQTNITSVLTLPVNLNLTDLDVMVDIDHPYISDVELKLQSPTGTVVQLVSGVGGSGDNFNGTIFDDQAGTPISSGSAPFSGSYIPEEPLAAFNGETTAGDWTLIVIDNYPTADNGILQEWSLTVTGESAAACVNGDVSGDGAIDIFDVIKTVNIILGILPPTDWELCSADYDDDGSVLVFDVIKIVNHILGGGGVRETVATAATLRQRGSGLFLEADGSVAGIQVDLETEGTVTVVAREGWVASQAKIGGRTRVVLFSPEGKSMVSGEFLTCSERFTVIDAAVADRKGREVVVRLVSIPTKVALLPPSPNPFNPVTNLSFDLPEDGEIQLEVIDVLGRRVATLAEGFRVAGTHEVQWIASAYPSGVYYCRMTTPWGIRTTRLVLLK